MSVSATVDRPCLTRHDTPDAMNKLVGKLHGDRRATLKTAKSDVTKGVDQIRNRQLVQAARRVATELTPAQSDNDEGPSLGSSGDSASEDYDALEIDLTALVDGSKDDSTYHEPGLSGTPEAQVDDICKTRGISSKSWLNIRSKSSGRQKGIQIKLEKTDQRGQYVLTADDPEIREILRRGIEREAVASLDPSKRPRTSFRDLVFTRQFTTFDRQNPLSSGSPFHGFFTMFWLCMVMLFLKVAANNWKVYGSIFGNNEIMQLMFSREIGLLFVTDILICSATTFGFGLQQLIYQGWLSWSRSGWIIQNVWQTFYLWTIIGWTMYRDWPWTHTVFIVLHTLVLLMKQHSYASYNGYLSQVYRRRALLQQHLHKLNVIEPTISPAVNAHLNPQTFSNVHMHTTDASEDNSLRYRRRSMADKSSTDLKAEHSEVAIVASAIESGRPLDAAQMRAFSRIIKAEIRALTEELKGKCTEGHNCYPQNLTLSNFIDWACLPTLVYELEYPRQDRINWWYVAEKTAATFGVIGVMMVISQAYIYPSVAETVRMKEAGMSLQERWREFPWILIDILFPLLLEQLLSWYVIWECVLNVLAELTRFADRGFYGDWWNSISWDQYARDWNRPVHNFLLRHVYHSSISAFHLSKQKATFVTFLLSACVHELLMLCIFKKLRGYLLAIQLLQLPLVSLSRTKLLKGRATLGNVFFWVGLFVGPSLVASLYLII